MIEVALIGCGGLGGALAHGLVKNSAFSLSICDRNDHKMAAFKALGAKTFTEVDAACEMADLILGCVKPHATPELMRSLKNQNAVFVSCAAGLELETLVPAYKGRVVRAMPNIGAQYQASATACFGDAEMNAQERALVEALFEQNHKSRRNHHQRARNARRERGTRCVFKDDSRSHRENDFNALMWCDCGQKLAHAFSGLYNGGSETLCT